MLRTGISKEYDHDSAHSRDTDSTVRRSVRLQALCLHYFYALRFVGLAESTFHM